MELVLAIGLNRARRVDMRRSGCYYAMLVVSTDQPRSQRGSDINGTLLGRWSE